MIVLRKNAIIVNACRVRWAIECFYGEFLALFHVLPSVFAMYCAFVHRKFSMV